MPQVLLNTQVNTSTLLTLIQTFCKENGLPVPSTVINNSNTGVKQFLALMLKVVKDIRETTEWQQNLFTATWLSTGTEVQGTIQGLFPENLDYIIQDTFWNQTMRIPVWGPVPPGTRVALQTMVPAGPFYNYWVQNNMLTVNPAVPEGHQLIAMYKSNWCVTNEALTEYKISYQVDTDRAVFPDVVVEAGLLAFWKRAKEMPFTYEMTRYEGLKQSYGTRNVVMPTLFLDKGPMNLKPGIWVPSGSWNIPSSS